VAGEGIEPEVLIVRAPGVTTKLIVLSLISIINLCKNATLNNKIINFMNHFNKHFAIKNLPHPPGGRGGAKS
jgi:hypothetical protein